MNPLSYVHCFFVFFWPFVPAGVCHVGVQSARELEGFPGEGGGSVFWVGMGTRHALQPRFGRHTVSLSGQDAHADKKRGERCFWGFYFLSLSHEPTVSPCLAVFLASGRQAGAAWSAEDGGTTSERAERRGGSSAASTRAGGSDPRVE